MPVRSVSLKIMATAWLLAFALPCVAAPKATDRQAQIDQQFQAALTQVDAAQRELQRGWEKVSRRLDWVGTQFSNGTNTVERIVAKANGDLGYVVQIERVRFNVPGQANESSRDYRVTMLFRREAGGWRIIHRQADSQMMKVAPQ